MSTDFSKSREKRPRSSNDNNTSFVKNVTSRVSGLLPSRITKWFSSPSSSNTNGSAAAAEATDSSTEDEAPESPITQPPAKRMCFNVSSKFNQFGPTDGNSSINNIEITEIPVTSFAGPQFATNRSNISVTPIKMSDTITKEVTKEKREMDSQRFRSKQHSISSIGQSVAIKRKSIFDKSSNTEEAVKAKIKASANVEKDPSFKPHLLGSPFYPGRTMYGGAASSYINQANIQQKAVALVNETKANEDSTMSSSARRIMELLESYSSPLSEARRIPQYTKQKIDMNASTRRPGPYPNKSISYKTQELYVPSIASIMRLKQKSRLMDTTKAARQIIASHSSASNLPLPTEKFNTINASNKSEPDAPRQETEKEQSTKMTTKVKNKMWNNRHAQELYDIATPVKLPSVILQIDQNKLPKFTLDTPTASKLPATSTPKVALPAPKPVVTKNNNKLPISKPETVVTVSSSIFTFSDPVKVSCESLDIDITPPSFKFGSPERQIEKNIHNQGCTSPVVDLQKSVTNDDTKTHTTYENIQKSTFTNKDTSKSIMNKDTHESIVHEDTRKTTNKAKDWQCPDCWVNNKNDVTKCACCGYKKIKPITCALCKIAESQPGKDKCVNCDKMLSPPSGKSSKWKCDSCWVMNDANANKCVCCNGTNLSDECKAAKKAERDAIPKVAAPRHGVSLYVLKSQGIQNELPVQASTPSLFRSNNEDDNVLVNIAKSQNSNKWKCNSCLIMNDSNRSMCVCCGTERENQSKLPEVKFNFGKNTNTTFKFGIDPKAQQPTITNKMDIKAEQSEANNNNLATTPTFTFSLPSKKPQIHNNDLKTKSDDAVKFSFGIPKDATLSENKTVSMAIENDDEKAQEVPQVNFSSTVQEVTKPFSGFAPPQQDKNNKLSIPVPKLFTPPSEKKDTSKDLITQPLPASVDKPQTTNTFGGGLGSPSLRLSTNLFSLPSTSADPFTSTAQATVVTTSASTMLLTPTVQPTNEAITNSAPSVTKPLIASSLFSFGENSASTYGATPVSTLPAAVVTSDKPTFQFSFGSNTNVKPDTASSLLTGSNAQPVFNSSFGSAGENPKNSSGFGFNTGSSMGTGNTLSILGGNNGPSGNDGSGKTLGANTLTSHTMSGNGLSGNMLTGNSLAGNTFATNNLTGGSNVTAPNTLGGMNGLSGNTLTGGNGMQQDNSMNNNALTSNTSNIFGGAIQKENPWNSSNGALPSTNMFVSNTTTTNMQKPPAFSFTASTPFNSTSSQTFGNNAQPSQNIFGMNSQNNNAQPSPFANPVPNQTSGPMFGSSQPTSNPTPSMGMFGSPSIGPTPTFGTLNTSVPSFEASLAPAPAFNFGAPVQPTGVFGFGQQQPQQQTPQTGVYSFGGPTAPGPPQVQFAMGTAPNTAGRRMRKAVRRTTPR